MKTFTIKGGKTHRVFMRHTIYIYPCLVAWVWTSSWLWQHIVSFHIYLIRLTPNVITSCGRKRVKEKMKERGGIGADRGLYNKLFVQYPPPSLPPSVRLSIILLIISFCVCAAWWHARCLLFVCTLETEHSLEIASYTSVQAVGFCREPCPLIDIPRLHEWEL